MASSEQLVTFRGGHVAAWVVVQRLIDLEGRGCTFRLEDGGRFRVLPPERLTPDDIAFLRLRRDEARQVIAQAERMAHQPI